MPVEEVLANLNKKLDDAKEIKPMPTHRRKYHVEFYDYKASDWSTISSHINDFNAQNSADNAYKKHLAVRIIHGSGLKKLWIRRKLIDTKGMTQGEIDELIKHRGRK